RSRRHRGAPSRSSEQPRRGRAAKAPLYAAGRRADDAVVVELARSTIPGTLPDVVRSRLVVALALSASACASRSPDVLATRSTKTASDGGAAFVKSPVPFTACRAGRYKGIVYSVPDPQGWPVQFSGDISFSLVETLGGEISVLSDQSQLSGSGAN